MNRTKSQSAPGPATAELLDGLDINADLRSAAEVMDLNRLGSLQPFRHSFMRILVRQMVRDQWQVRCSQFELDDRGFGFAVYTIEAKAEIYSFVVFAAYLQDENRNDRVIAEQWDLTMALVRGLVKDKQLQRLRATVPMQEAARMTADMLVLSRANRSKRMFDYVVDALASGVQPEINRFKEVGYLCRTTAVYGSGKFGMADWGAVQHQCQSFAKPFAAEMFCCFMLRHFSVEQAQHIAHCKAPATAVSLDSDIRRYVGIGNATGLGMAPFLIKHPQLIAQWLLVREVAIARVLKMGEVTPDRLLKLQAMIKKVIQHTRETSVEDDNQADRNSQVIVDLENLTEILRENPALEDWLWLKKRLLEYYCQDTIEIVYSLLIELYPGLVDFMEKNLSVEENLQLCPEIALGELKQTIEADYDWSLAIDFKQPERQHVFWYRSEEKMEPRLGERYCEAGADKELPVQIAMAVKACYEKVCSHLIRYPNSDVIHFLLEHSDQTSIVKRIQTMSQLVYGDIQANLADQQMQPIHLLRAKLSFFGVSKFDPKSRLWVRNTMFQGAPLLNELDSDQHLDEWYFPLAPEG